jgi:pimeloyl-ACP methyl ester carboxylesterase
MPLPDPVIVVPGITATYLSDQYPIPPEIIWAVIRKDFARAALHPDDLRYEAKEPARVVPDQLYEIAYKELVDELRYNLSARAAEVPVYTFAHDWRQPLERLEDQLADFIEEVADRTRLMRHYHKDGYGERRTVNLVGHSMGGLIVGGYLARYGADARVNRVATLASPFQGSFEVVIKVTTGTANLGTSPPSSREREAARLTPALYYLVPSFRAGIEVDDGLPNTLFDPRLWQPSIVETIATYIEDHGVEPPGRRTDRLDKARDVLRRFLASARTHRRRLDRLDLAAAGLAPADWLCIVGVGAKTRTRLKVERRGQHPNFAFRSADRADHWEDGASARERRATGDGTVPFEGAIPKFLPYESLVCLTPGDFGYWEIADKAAVKVGGFHGILPNMNVIHRLIVRHFTGAGDPHQNTWGRSPPGVSADTWTPPLRPLRDR